MGVNNTATCTIVHSSLNDHEKVVHIDDSRLWSNSALQDGQNANISDTDKGRVEMAGQDSPPI